MMAKIRHIAIFTDDANELAEFYRDVFGMTIRKSTKEPNFAWLTDGELEMALLPRRSANSAQTAPPKGINHFGFSMTPGEKEQVLEKLKTYGCKVFHPGPNRPYAELGSRDIEGNRFDISTALEMSRTDSMEDRYKEAEARRNQAAAK
jgi:catechol 2,3-dioxygenase-like lactoylglutathione lyase family enzyme